MNDDLELDTILGPFLVIVLGRLGHLPDAAAPARSDQPGDRALGRRCLGGAWALLLLASLWTPPGPFLTSVFFYVFSVAAIAGGVLTVTSRNPIYSALWFASVVLATSGLFLLAGAPFLAAGTVIVYAGAIIVTFLFVIMLAQMEGQAIYDRAARAPGPRRSPASCSSGASSTLCSRPGTCPRPGSQARAPGAASRPNPIVGSSPNVTSSETEHRDAPTGPRSARSRPRRASPLPGGDGPAATPHVAGLGESLYTDHLVTVGLAGALSVRRARRGRRDRHAPSRPCRPTTHRPTEG